MFQKYTVKFGQYVEASDDAIVANTMKTLTNTCLTMTPSGNFQSSIACVELTRGNILAHHIVTILPMQEQVRKLVNKWGL